MRKAAGTTVKLWIGKRPQMTSMLLPLGTGDVSDEKEAKNNAGSPTCFLGQHVLQL
jgi:hypothetical protein